MKVCTYSNKTIREWYDTIWKDFDLSCSMKLRYMNDVLDLLRIDTYRLKSNQVVVEFSSSWEQDISLPFPIYEIEWRYTKWDINNVQDNLDILTDACYSCGDKNKLMWIRMHDVWAYINLDSCQYAYCRDSNTISANIPTNVTSWYVKYYKYFNPLTSLDDPLPIQPSLYPALKMLMKVYYYEIAWSWYDWDDSKYEARYEKFIKKQIERDQARIERVKPLSNEF